MSKNKKDIEDRIKEIQAHKKRLHILIEESQVKLDNYQNEIAAMQVKETFTETNKRYIKQKTLDAKKEGLTNKQAIAKLKKFHQMSPLDRAYKQGRKR